MQYKNDYISVTYVLKYRLKVCKYIKFTEDFKMVFNTRSGKEIMCSNNHKKGFWCKRKFYRIDKIKDKIELIPKYEVNKNNFLTKF